jgi:MraZ protein
MLSGEHEHSLDDKNRLTLPARLREQLGDRVVIARGLDGCLSVYAYPEWESLAGRVGTLDQFSGDVRTMQRNVFASAVEADLDKQGRVVIPSALLESRGIGREVTVVGVYNRLEIWDRSAWHDQRQHDEGRAEDVAERLANRD